MVTYGKILRFSSVSGVAFPVCEALEECGALRAQVCTIGSTHAGTIDHGLSTITMITMANYH